MWKFHTSRLRRLSALLLVLCLLCTSLPAAFAQDAEGEISAEATVNIAPAVQETVIEPAASVVEEAPVPPVSEEEPAALPEEEAPAAEETVEEAPAEEETVEETTVEDVPCYVTVCRDAEIFNDSGMTDSAGKVLKDTVLYKTHTEDDVYTVLFARDGEVLEGYIRTGSCEIADEEAVAAYLLLANADENAIEHTTKDNVKIVLLNAVAEETAAEAAAPEAPAAEETVTEETKPQEQPAEETEAAEETVAAEAAEETETAVQDKFADPYAAFTGIGTATEKTESWASEPENLYIYQSDVRKVTLSWDPQYAASYVVYEFVGDKRVKRGTTNTNCITVSASTFGDHCYGVFPCSDKNGRGAVSENCATASISTYNQTWRKAPNVKVAQLTDGEGRYSVTWDLDQNPGTLGYELCIQYEDNSKECFSFDSNGDIIDKAASKAVTEAHAGNSEMFTAEKAAVDKAVSTVTWNFDGPYELLSTRTLKINVTRVGIVNDNTGDEGYGKPSAWKTLKIVPQWSKAPKITSLKQTSDEEYEARIEWTFTGKPDGFRLYYSKNAKPIECDAPEEGNQASLDLTFPGPGSYSFKIVPYKVDDDGNVFEGKASGAKSIRMKLAWATKKLKLNARQISGKELMLSWDAIDGVTGYEVDEVSGSGRNTSYDYVGFTEDTSYVLTPSSSGYHTYVVRPCLRKLAGTFSNAKKVYFTLTDVPTPPSVVPEGTVYRAYVVGNTYPGSYLYLPNCDTDAKSMAAMLRSMTGTEYKVTYEINRNNAQILSGIATAFAGAKEGDVSLFYYSGHGENGTGRLCGTGDTRISFSELREALDQVPGDKIVLLDSCYSGGAINKDYDSDMEKYANAAIAAFANSAVGTFANSVPKSGELAASSYYVMTACRMDQTSSSMAEGYSLFTKCFEEVCGWNELSNSMLDSASADTDNDGAITMTEAYTATFDAVEAEKATYNASHPNDHVNQVTRANPEISSFILFKR